MKGTATLYLRHRTWDCPVQAKYGDCYDCHAIQRAATIKVINVPHCQQCGCTDPEETASRSYSGCCNEIVMSGGTCQNGSCYHGVE